MTTCIRIGFYESWRKEFRDLIHALSTSSRTTMIKLRPNSEMSARDIDVVIVSDYQRVVKESDNHPPVIRVMWNGPLEVLENIRKNPEQSNDKYLTFFTDVAAVLSEFVPTAYVPFVFSKPSFLFAPTATRIGYVGEVDISEQCFQKYDKSYSSLAIESARELSLEIHNGNQTLSDVLRAAPSEFHGVSDLTSLWKWSVLNWVRYRFISSLVTAFPRQVELRGTDWMNLGFEAKKSRYHPLIREFAYARNAVSVDFGSKSTTDCIYPRSTEIIVNNGGLLQLNSGGSPPPSMTELSKRRFDSVSDLLTMTDQKLSAPSKVRNKSDDTLRKELVFQRNHAINDLIEICTMACREAESD
jgi:hypothetical protein